MACGSAHQIHANCPASRLPLPVLRRLAHWPLMISYRSPARPKPVATCPYCRQKIGPRHEVRWTGMQAKVIDTLTEFGERGATTEELALVVYGGTEYHRKIVSLIYIMRARLEDTSWEIWHPHSHFGHYVLRRRN